MERSAGVGITELVLAAVGGKLISGKKKSVTKSAAISNPPGWGLCLFS